MKYSFLLFFLYLFSNFSFGQSKSDSLVVLEGGFQNVEFHQKVFQLEESNGIDFLPQLMKTRRALFDRNTHSQEVDFGLFHDKGWSKFYLKNNSDEPFVMLKVNQSRVDLIRLFVERQPHPLSPPLPKRGGLLDPINSESPSFIKIDSFPSISRTLNYYQRPILSNNFVYKIPLQKGENLTFYLYSERKYGHHALVMNLMSESNFMQYENRLNFSLAMIIGMALLVIIINIAFFSIVYQRVYLYYGLYTFFILSLVLADAGYFHTYLIFPKFQFQINATTTISFYFAIGMQLLFTVVLLEIVEVKQKWFYYVGRIGAALCFLMGGILLFFNQNYTVNWWVIYISYYHVFFLDVYVIIAIIISIRRKLRVAYFYTAGFLISTFVSTLLVLANLGIVDGINQSSDFFYFTPFFEIVIMVLGFGFTFSDNLREKYVMQKRLNDTQKSIISIQESERKRIGQDLHDDVGNTLAALNTLLKNRYADDQEVSGVVTNVIHEVRQISHNLMPIDFEKYSLSDVIQDTVRKFKTKDLDIDFVEAGQKKVLKPEINLELYRIFNEILTNIIKHSKASHATVQMIYQQDSLVMSVEDNGRGFDIKSTTSDGIGLKNIASRAAFIQAKLTIQSDDKGTLILLDLPIKL